MGGAGAYGGMAESAVIMKKPTFLRRVSYGVEALLFALLLTIFRLLPLRIASAFGGWLGRKIGPKLKWNRVAQTNLQRAMPEKSAAEHAAILYGLWDNLGRTFAEYPRLGTKAMAARVHTTARGKALMAEVASAAQPTIFISGHLANWEVLPWVAALHQLPLTLIYRYINNPYVERIIHHIRSRYCAGLYPKGRIGATAALKCLREGGALGMLIDQKMNDGIAIPFFGMPAMTAPAAVELALKYNTRLLLVRIIREPDAVSFTIDMEEVTMDAYRADKSAATVALLTEIHRRMEAWIREHPSQWLWVHQRWGKLSELR